MSVVATSAGAASQPDWSVLISFVVAPAVALVAVVAVYLYWRAGNAALPASAKGFLSPLNGLEASWSFKDSWATNVTAGGGLVITVLGSSDFLKAVLGPNPDAALGVATVAGAIALAVVGAAGVLVLTLKHPSSSGVTIGGLLSGTVVALGAAGGEVWAITLAVNRVSLGVGNTILMIAAVLASLLLLAYAWTSINGLLTQGQVHVSDPFDSPGPEILAAAVMAASQHDAATRQNVMAVLAALKKPPTGDRIHAAEHALPVHPLRVRSALP